MFILKPEAAQQFAQDWIESWNSHDLDAILSHYAEDLELSSPLIPTIAGEPSGVLKGKTAIKAYWKKGLDQIPDLHFVFQEVLVGIESLTIYYRGHRGMVAEVLIFNAQGKVKQALACYAS